MSAVEEVATSASFIPVANGMMVSRKTTSSKMSEGLRTDGVQEGEGDYRTDANSEFGENLKQALFNLKALNGQANLSESEPVKSEDKDKMILGKSINGSNHDSEDTDLTTTNDQQDSQEYSQSESANKNISSETNGDDDDDDVILLDEASSCSKQKNGESGCSEEQKSHPYTIGNDVKNCFKDIISKMGASDSTQTVTDSESTMEISPARSPSVMVVDDSESDSPNAKTDGTEKNLSGNLFENIGSLNSDKKSAQSVDTTKVPSDQSKPVNSSGEGKAASVPSDDEVIDLDDDLLLEDSDSKSDVCDTDINKDTDEQSCDIVKVQSKGDNPNREKQTDPDLSHFCDKQEEQTKVTDIYSLKDDEQTSNTIDIKSDSESEKETEIVKTKSLLEHSPSSSTRSEQDSVVLEHESEEKMDTSEDKCDTVLDEKSGELLAQSDLKPNQEFKNPACETSETLKNEEKCPTKYETSPGDRKRPADGLEISSEPKRSRLEMVIGKLGTQIGISPEAIKCVDEVSDTEESPQESESTDKSEDATSSVTEDEESESGSRSRRKPIRLSEKELEEVVRRKVVAYLNTERECMVAELRKKLDDIQILYEASRAEVRELQKSVVDLTILNQKHEKRKAATAALRQITSRSVGVQVDEAKANLMSQLGTPHKTVKTPPRCGPATPPKANPSPIAGALSTAPLSSLTAPKLSTPSTSLPAIAPSPQTVMIPVSALNAMNRTPVSATAMTNQSVTALLQKTALTGTCGASTVRSLLDTSRSTQVAVTSTTSAPTIPVIGQSAQAQGLIMVSGGNSAVGRSLLAPTKTMVTTTNVVASTAIQQVVQAAAASGATVKVIDLTGDDDSVAKQASTFTAFPVGTVMRPAPGIATSGVGQVLRQMTPVQQQVGQQGIFLSAPMVKTTQGSAVQHPTYQLVFNSSSPAIRAGNVLTVVTGATTQTGNVRPISTLVTTGLGGNTQLVRATQPSPNITIATKPLTAVLQPTTTLVRPPPPLQTAPVLQTVSTASTTTTVMPVQHPAPFPHQPINQVLQGQKALPPKPGLKISRVSQGIVLSWNMTVQDVHAEISNYQLFAYQETSTPPHCNLWKKVGDVKALPLPMACTLTQFQEGNRYHFAVRAIDGYSRIGPFSDPSTIHLTSANRA